MRLKRILATATLALGTSFITSTAFARVDVGVSVGLAPPPPQVPPGPVGVAPGPGYVWTNGYWDWNGGTWVGWADAGWFHRTGTVSGLSRIIIPTVVVHTTTIAATGANALN
jgi:hypothetical protein